MTTEKGGRPCRVCSHPRRAEIETALRNGAKVATLVEVYGVGEGNIRRHAKNHAKAGAVPAQTNQVLPDAEPSKLAKLLSLRTLKVLRDGEASGNPRVQLAALRVARENLETVAKLRATEPADYAPERDELLAALRDRLAATLRGYPEALEAVRADFRAVAEGK